MKILTIFLSIFLLPTILLAEINALYNLDLENINNDNQTYFDGSLTLTSDTDVKTLTILKDGFYDFAINGKPVLNRSRIIDIELSKKTPTVISYKKKITNIDNITASEISLINIAPEIMDNQSIIYLFNIKTPKTFTPKKSKNKNTVTFNLNHPFKDLDIKDKTNKKTTVSTYIFKIDKKNNQSINSLYGHSNHYKNMLKSLYPDIELSTSLLYNDDYAVILDIYAQ